MFNGIACDEKINQRQLVSIVVHEKWTNLLNLSNKSIQFSLEFLELIDGVEILLLVFFFLFFSGLKNYKIVKRLCDIN